MSASSIRISWHFDAPQKEVWATWTEVDAVRQWFGSDPKGQVIQADLSPQPGGRFTVTFVDSDGTEHTASGVYEKMDPYRFLSFTWEWKSEPGIVTTISISLVPDADGTTMLFEHSGLFHVSSHDYETGWRSTFAKFENVLAQSK